MGWRDLIMTSQPRPEAPTKPAKGTCEDIEPRYTKKSSLSTENSPQNSTPLKASSISSELLPSAPLDSVVLGGPLPPLQPGWLVVYRGASGKFCGGCDDRAHGTVQGCDWDGRAWTVVLTDGQRLPLTGIRSVGRTNAASEIVAAWTVLEHGYDGEDGQG
jgi:hypothetical protein